MFKIIQIIIGVVLIAMVWLGDKLAMDQKLAFTVLIALLLVDKFINFDKISSNKTMSQRDDHTA